MSYQLGLLKHIPCPAGDNCTAFRCLFRHKGDEEIWPLSGDNRTVGIAAPGTKHDHRPGQEGPRKRAKTGDQEYDPAESYDPASPPFPESPREYSPESAPKPLNPVAANYVPDKETSLLPATAQRPVSPPPVKRKGFVRAAGAPAPSKARSLGGPTSPGLKTKAVPTTAAASPATQKSAARKMETLNPRHLTFAPATHEQRYRILKLLHAEIVRLNSELAKSTDDEDKKLVMSDQELIWLALDEEEKYAKNKPNIYSGTIKHRIVAYKRMPLTQWKKDRTEARNKELAMTQPKQQQKQQAAGHGPPVVIDTGLTAEQEVAFLKAKLLTPADGLAHHGYVPTVPTEEDIQKARDASQISKGWEVCDRCSTRFQVFPGRREEDGALASGGKCTHHPGRAYYPPKEPGVKSSGTRRYRCCNEVPGDSPGCTVGDTHVFKTSDPKRLALLWNFAETPPNPSAPADRAVCFDCEMGYTVYGLELIRLTATAWPGGEELLDVLVRPLGETLDLNSRYSGVYPEDMVNAVSYSPPTAAAATSTTATTATGLTAPHPTAVANLGERRRLPIVPSPMAARDLLFALIAPDTPLIGHGLENDLNSVRIVHPTLADTILLFPHPKGLPVRYGLKVLMETHLNRRIQVEVGGEGAPLAGHDSAEDARAAGDLVRFKIMKEWARMREGGWKIEDGAQFVPPPGLQIQPASRAGLPMESFVDSID